MGCGGAASWLVDTAAPSEGSYGFRENQLPQSTQAFEHFLSPLLQFPGSFRRSPLYHSSQQQMAARLGGQWHHGVDDARMVVCRDPQWRRKCSLRGRGIRRLSSLVREPRSWELLPLRRRCNLVQSAQSILLQPQVHRGGRDDLGIESAGVVSPLPPPAHESVSRPRPWALYAWSMRVPSLCAVVARYCRAALSCSGPARSDRSVGEMVGGGVARGPCGAMVRWCFSAWACPNVIGILWGECQDGKWARRQPLGVERSETLERAGFKM